MKRITQRMSVAGTRLSLLMLFLALLPNMATAQCPDNNHPHMIDLGLDDGTLWACCNLGAFSPEESGDYFAWGETIPKNFYSWDTYQWSEGSAYSITKYNYNTSYGTIDDRFELDLEDDAAYINWGSNWHVPSIDQIRFLVSGTTHERATVDGVNGFILKGKNGNTIFLPDAGSMQYDEFHEDRSYWTRTLDYAESFSEPSNAIKVNFTDDGGLMRCHYPRRNGYPIRPVALVPSTTNVILNASNFPDGNFRKLLAEKYNVHNNGNSEISAERIAATSILKVSEKSITNFKGIEFFTALTKLYCDNNLLTSIDISNNTMLLDLDISNNMVTSFNTSNNTYLESLDCSNNHLISLDVSKSTWLSSLDCSNNQMSMLDISKNRDLDYLDCSNNLLTSLNTASCWHLRTLSCFRNRLSSLKGLNNSYRFLYTVLCYSNQIKGSAMDELVNSLWAAGGNNIFVVIDSKDGYEGNICTNNNVSIANSKGWVVYDYNGGDMHEYVDPAGISPINNECLIINNYYTLDGRMLQGKPNQKGIYIHNGRKSVIK